MATSTTAVVPNNIQERYKEDNEEGAVAKGHHHNQHLKTRHRHLQLQLQLQLQLRMTTTSQDIHGGMDGGWDSRHDNSRFMCIATLTCPTAQQHVD
jgi:hypothetical protein